MDGQSNDAVELHQNDKTTHIGFVFDSLSMDRVHRDQDVAMELISCDGAMCS